MRRIFASVIASWWVAWWTLGVGAEEAVVHRGGRARMEIIGGGSLAGAADGSYAAPNFFYPVSDPDLRPYLGSYSEVWVGTETPPVASAVNLTAEGRLEAGEWTTAPFGAPRSIGTFVPEMERIAARYQAKLSDTFTVLVEQESTSWKDPKTGESNGVALKFTLSNLGELPQRRVYLALATNWDVDIALPPAGNPNLDMVFWDASRRASVVYDGSSSDGTTPVHVATALLEGKLHAHRILPVPQTPWTFTDEQRSAIFSLPLVQEQTLVPQNYFTVLVVGPFDLVGKNPVVGTFAFVGGESRQEVLANVEAVRRAAFRPERLHTEAVEGGIRISWTPPLVSDVVGYALFRSSSSAGPFEPVGPRILASTEFVDVDVVPGATYFYRVHAVNNAEEVVDAPSAVVTGATGPKPLSIPTLQAAVEMRQGVPVVRLSFPPGDYGASKVALYRNETGQEPWTLIQMLNFTTSLRDGEVSPGKTYYYVVRLVSDVGRWGDFSKPVQVGVPSVSPSLSTDFSKTLAVPNPVRQGETIRFLNLPPRVTISIYAPSGERIARLDSLDAPSVTWQPPPHLASGVYLYQIQRIPEATSEGFNSAPQNRELESIFGKIAVLR